MQYKVHRLDITMKEGQSKLEQFLNTLKGEVVSIVANVRPTFQGMGGTAKVDFLFIVEKIE